MAAAGAAHDAAELVVKDLTIAYDARSPVVREFSVRVPPGQTLALLGANGAGKTSVMRAITGLLDVHGGRIVSGSIRLDGREATTLSAARRVRAGMAQTMEGRRVFADLTVEENLRSGALGRRGASTLRGDLDAAYDRFPELATRRRTKAGLLSGGQQQMLAIGRALMARPRILLLDEPSLGLAPKLVDRVAETIEEIKKEGTTVLLIEQNVATSLRVADHAVVLETGRVVLSGPADELREDPRIQSAYLGGHANLASPGEATPRVG